MSTGKHFVFAQTRSKSWVVHAADEQQAISRFTAAVRGRFGFSPGLTKEYIQAQLEDGLLTMHASELVLALGDEER